jgi:hypothetical protein
MLLVLINCRWLEPTVSDRFKIIGLSRIVWLKPMIFGISYPSAKAAAIDTENLFE